MVLVWRSLRSTAHQRIFSPSVHIRSRTLATHANVLHSNPKTYSATVVGAGPGGLAIVGNLLAANVHAAGPIAWVDPAFQGGTLGAAWREVTSNTRVNLFVAYAEALAPFRQVLDRKRDDGAVERLRELEQGGTCDIAYAADLVEGLGKGVLEEFGGAVERKVGWFSGGEYVDGSAASDGGAWTVQIQRGASNALQSLRSTRLMLATGAQPAYLPLPIPGLEIERLDLTTALTPSQLSQTISRDEPATVAVIGASHSGILILMNLVRLAQSTHPRLRVKWFTRSPLKYAEYKDGWILYDNTGLKGNAAAFAREQLDDGVLGSSAAGRVVTRVDLTAAHERALYAEHLPSCTHIVHATGFTTPAPPKLLHAGKVLAPSYDHEHGHFVEGGRQVPGLYGAGIAYPERVVDPEGNVEMSVGMWKFMKYLKRVVPEWVGKSA